MAGCALLRNNTGFGKRAAGNTSTFTGAGAFLLVTRLGLRLRDGVGCGAGPTPSERRSATTRKRRLGASAAMRQVAYWSVAFGTPLAHDPAMLAVATAAAVEGRFSFRDAMLLATAEGGGCTAMMFEDMAPGARLGRIRVVPAFAGDAVSPEALALLA